MALAGWAASKQGLATSPTTHGGEVGWGDVRLDKGDCVCHRHCLDQRHNLIDCQLAGVGAVGVAAQVCARLSLLSDCNKGAKVGGGAA